LLDTVQGRPKGLSDLRRRYLGRVIQRHSRLVESAAVQRSRCSTGRVDKCVREDRQYLAGTSRHRLLEFGDGSLEPATQIDPVIGVADRRIEVGQMIGVLGHQAGRLDDPCAERTGVHHVLVVIDQCGNVLRETQRDSSAAFQLGPMPASFSHDGAQQDASFGKPEQRFAEFPLGWRLCQYGFLVAWRVRQAFMASLSGARPPDIGSRDEDMALAPLTSLTPAWRLGEI
jgi:hypothetical protein